MKDYLEKHKEEFKRWLVDNEQGRIDIKVLPYLPEKGFFVEAGALDGLFMNNTKILEDLGWEGILIEPSQGAYDKCKQNRKAIVENCALVSFEYKGDTVKGDFFFDGFEGRGAWSSINRHTYTLPAEVEVKARTLDSILKEHKVDRVDFLSLDVEGYELEVLRGINFDEVDITHILVEVNLNQYSLENMDDFLTKRGYKNRGCLSNFSVESNPGWDGFHQDYLYSK